MKFPPGVAPCRILLYGDCSVTGGVLLRQRARKSLTHRGTKPEFLVSQSCLQHQPSPTLLPLCCKHQHGKACGGQECSGTLRLRSVKTVWCTVPSAGAEYPPSASDAQTHAAGMEGCLAANRISIFEPLKVQRAGDPIHQIPVDPPAPPRNTYFVKTQDFVLFVGAMECHGLMMMRHGMEAPRKQSAVVSSGPTRLEQTSPQSVKDWPTARRGIPLRKPWAPSRQASVRC
jgi:hypothetical protein